jgi:hypothetical protein
MNIINQAKFSILFPELKQYNLDEATIIKLLNNSEFKKSYTTIIIPFMAHLKDIDQTDRIIPELNIIANFTSLKQIQEYTKLASNNISIKDKITSPDIMTDPNFAKVYTLLGNDTFNDNIVAIFKSHNSAKLLEINAKLLKDNHQILNKDLFNDQIWALVNKNDQASLKFYTKMADKLMVLIQKNYFNGFLYTLKNVPESNFFMKLMSNSNIDDFSFAQFSPEFINNVGLDTLKQMYKQQRFDLKFNYEPIFAIAKTGNYNLIKDWVDYNKDGDYSFKEIPASEYSKNIMEIKGLTLNKTSLLLNKYFGINKEEFEHMRYFIDTVYPVMHNYPEFMNKYGEIVNTLYNIYHLPEYEMVALAKQFDEKMASKNVEMIKQCEMAGNQILSNQFADDIQRKDEMSRKNATSCSINTKDGHKIIIYDFQGKPFTLLVHAVGNNPLSSNNSIGRKIVENPTSWNEEMAANAHISTSLISDKYLHTYDNPSSSTLMFGFNHLSADAVKCMDVRDIGIPRESSVPFVANSRSSNFSQQLNTVSTVDKLMGATIDNYIKQPTQNQNWNEVVLNRQNLATSQKLQPDYVVCYDCLNAEAIKAASEFNIPIYLIEREYYPNLSDQYGLTNNPLKR